MRFIEGPPTLAVEVRSEGDYGPKAEAEIRGSGPTTSRPARSSSGTSTRSPRRSARTAADRPDAPAVYGRGTVAEAEPAVPGWRPAVDELFEE